MKVYRLILRVRKEDETMYAFKTDKIGKISVLEFVPLDSSDKPLPIALFYHGWTNTKEDCATEAIELVKRGFRVIIPDCLMHGERYILNTKIPADAFFKVILQNTDEFSQIITHYAGIGLIKDNFIAVAGLSMGGITTCMLLTQHPEISAASVLMGTPQLINYSKMLTEAYYTSIPKTAKDAEVQMKAQFKQFDNNLTPFDLSFAPEKIANRPLLFWHAQADPTVPHHLTAEFFESIQDHPTASNTHFISDVGGKHKVTYLAAFRQAAFLAACYQEKTEDIWSATQKAVIKRFGDNSAEIFQYNSY